MERYLVENCSPTLASLKTGNLFSYKYDSLEEVEFYVEFWNQCMAEKGVSFQPVRHFSVLLVSPILHELFFFFKPIS